MTVLVGNHDFLTGCKLNGDSVLNAEFCLEYVEISTNGVYCFLFILYEGIYRLTNNCIEKIVLERKVLSICYPKFNFILNTFSFGSFF